MPPAAFMLQELLVPFEDQRNMTVPFATSSSVFDCEVLVCWTVLQRIAIANASAELIIILVSFVIFVLYLLILTVRNSSISKRGVILQEATKAILDEKRLERSPKWNMFFHLAALFLLLGIIASFFCFLFIPDACETAEKISLVNETDGGKLSTGVYKELCVRI